MFAEYYLIPLTLAIVCLGLALLALWGLRKSRASVKRYNGASAEARTELDGKMEQDFLLSAKMKHLSGWRLLGIAVSFFVVMTLLKWART